jgi:HlyD family secretion protein
MEPMDRPLDRAFRRQRLARRVGVALATTAVLAVGLGWGAAALRPTLPRGSIRTAVVDVGPLDELVSAAGTVVPEIEQVVSMPLDARVLKIRKRPGDAVARGEAILDLDLSAAALEQDRLTQTLALRANQQARTRLDLQTRLLDLESQREVKSLQLATLAAKREGDRQLHGRGLLAREILAQSELLEAQAGAELRRIMGEERTAREISRNTLHGLALEMATLRRESAEARRQLELLTTRADRPGVVTWTVTEEGGIARKGEIVARIADLRSFRLDATVSEVHAQRIAAGLPVRVRVNEASSLQGTVANVDPTIRDGMVTFSVALRERSSPLLRPNLRVDALVITSRKERAVRVARGPFAEGGGLREVFLVRGDQAVRSKVKLGMAGPDSFEVIAGLSPGDVAIISDMDDYLHLDHVALR